jgi:hypothetical protein
MINKDKGQNWIVKGSIAILKLKGGTVKINSSDLSVVKKYTWYIDENGYVRTFIYPGGKKESFYLHQLLKRPSKGKQVDHINGDLLDCRRNNLRVVNSTSNIRNKGLKKTNKSGVTGVWYNEKTKKWFAYIWNAYKKHHLGSFDKKEDAVKARKKAEKEIFGNDKQR